MISNPLDKLRANKLRTALLMAELGGWLHMIGKMDSRFLHKEGLIDGGDSDNIKYWYQDPCRFWAQEHPEFCRLLQENIAPSLSGLKVDQHIIHGNAKEPVCLADFAKYHTNRLPGNSWNKFFLVVNDAHGMASATEKGTLPRHEGKQRRGATYLANAFGYEASQGVTDPDTVRRELVADLVEPLRAIILKAIRDELSAEDWKRFRYGPNGAGAEQDRGLLPLLRRHMEQALAETRRPENDVTLWDQTSIAAAMLRAALVKALLDPNAHQELQQAAAALPGKKVNPAKKARFKWRLLRIYFSGLDFLSRAHGVPDLLGRKQALEQAQDRVRALLEVEYPLGTEVYRDENNQVFLVPDFDNLLDWQGETTSKTLSKMIQEAFADALHGEIWPRLHLGEHSRTAGNLWNVLQHPLSRPVPLPKKLQESHAQVGTAFELCTACRLRYRSSGSEQALDLCEVCRNRRARRLVEWRNQQQGQSPTPTIWITEAADGNGRVALVAARFDLKHWLSGLMVSTLPGRDVHGLLGRVKRGFDKSVRVISRVLRNKNSQRVWNQVEFLKVGLEDTSVERGLGDKSVREVYEELVKEREWATGGFFKPPDPATEPQAAARLLVNTICSKQASFARLRRIWETTRSFWPSAEALPKWVGLRTLRLKLVGQATAQPRLNQVYEFTLSGAKMNVLPLDERGAEWLVLENLAYLARKLGCKIEAGDEEADVAAKLQQRLQPFQGRPDDQGHPQGNRYRLTIPDSGEVLDVFVHNFVFTKKRYIPAIPLIDTPQLFMALIPADQVPRFIRQLEREYNRKLGKVQGRLPLHLSIAVFGSRQPLYVAMDAVRRMQRRPSPPERWQVRSVQLTVEKGDVYWTYDLFDDETKTSAVAAFPAQLGDGTIDPFLYLPMEKVGHAKVCNYLAWQAPWPSQGAPEYAYMVRPADVSKGDVMLYIPSTVDVEYLDSSARRYNLVYGDNGRRRPTDSGAFTGPFYLEQWSDVVRVWEMLSQLTATQRHQLIETIESQRIQWSIAAGRDHDWTQDRTFRTWVEHTLARAGERWWAQRSPADRQLLIDWGAGGHLAQTYRLFARILKLGGRRPYDPDSFPAVCSLDPGSCPHWHRWLPVRANRSNGGPGAGNRSAQDSGHLHFRTHPHGPS